MKSHLSWFFFSVYKYDQPKSNGSNYYNKKCKCSGIAHIPSREIKLSFKSVSKVYLTKFRNAWISSSKTMTTHEKLSFVWCPLIVHAYNNFTNNYENRVSEKQEAALPFWCLCDLGGQIIILKWVEVIIVMALNGRSHNHVKAKNT